MPFLPPAAPPLRIALVSNLTNDRREVEVDEAAPIVIGRASRSKGKHLEPQANNTYFDCPVVSRVHAELRMVPAKPSELPQLTIADMTSLHGTKVNGQPLKPGFPFTLQPGDVIKLGERVTRGDGTYSLKSSTSTCLRPANVHLDAHEGVSLTFHRLHTPPTSIPSSTLELMPAYTSRGFRAPSFSDASDPDSDHDVSDGEHHTSSAKTTPEQNKMTLGSQHAPITVDTDLPSSDDGDITFSRSVPERDLHPALIIPQQTDFDRFSDADSVHDARPNEVDDLVSAQGGFSDEDSDIDHDDDAEYGCDIDAADDMSNPASDFSSEAGSRGDEEGPSHREPSPELGIFDDEPEASLAQSEALSDMWIAPASKQYDPVRSSLPLVEQTSEPHRPTGRTTTTPFTGHWDVQHLMPSNVYQPPVYQSGSPLELARPLPNPQPLFPMSIDAIVEPLHQADAEQISKTIDDSIISTQAAIEPVQDVAAGATVPKTGSENVAETSSKRKRDELEEAADIPCSPAKRAAPARRRLTPKKRRSFIRKAVVSVTQATAFAAVGAIGTVAFLSSPMAESLIQWLG